LVNGTMDANKRREKLNTIKTDPSVTVILVCLMAGGTGLNFTECKMFDLWWNPAVEEQAFACAHRMGQTRPVNIYKLVSRDTIEMQVIEVSLFHLMSYSVDEMDLNSSKQRRSNSLLRYWTGMKLRT
ncbi:MAG: P-loop containing nucleoside triphosphate hydrolase protein, partial [Lentinula lateritia]